MHKLIHDGIDPQKLNGTTVTKGIATTVTMVVEIRNFKDTTIPHAISLTVEEASSSIS